MCGVDHQSEYRQASVGCEGGFRSGVEPLISLEEFAVINQVLSGM